jgi:hypothetical protein
MFGFSKKKRKEAKKPEVLQKEEKKVFPANRKDPTKKTHRRKVSLLPPAAERLV